MFQILTAIGIVGVVVIVVYWVFKYYKDKPVKFTDIEIVVFGGFDE